MAGGEALDRNVNSTSAGPEQEKSSAAELACLIALASQAWRLSKLSKRVSEKLSYEDGHRAVSQIRYIEREMEDELQKVGLRVVDLAGERFDPGMAVSALNAEDFQANDELWISQTIEPVIMGPSGLLKYGVVMLAKANQ
jgi:hypothetical protein